MEITCTTGKLKEIVSSVDRLTAKHPSLPTLAYILCTVTKNTISFRATNLSIGAEGSISGKSVSDGVVALDGKTLLQALGGNLDSETTLTLKGETLSVVSGKYKSVLKTFPHDDFPTLPKIEGETITIPSKVFTQGIESVVYAASGSDIKPEIASVYIYPEDTSLTFTATDTFRLAEKKISLDNTYGFPSLLIPAKNALEIAKIVNTTDESLSLSFSETQLTISYKGMYITSRVTHGSFPNYRQIIPKNTTTEAVFLKKELEETLKSLTSFSDKFNQVTITFSPKDKKCTFFAENGDRGEQTVEVEGALTGEPITVYVNARYILDMMSIITTDSISFSLMNQKPIILKGVGDQNFLYLVMPINRA